VIINKDTIPSPDLNDTMFGYAQNVEGTSGFQLSDGGEKTYTNVIPGSYYVSENDPEALGYYLSNLTCEDRGAPDISSSTTDMTLRKAFINVDPGETVECWFENTAYGHVDLLKLTDGSDMYSYIWKFTLDGMGQSYDDNTSDGPLVDFGGVNLKPGTYTICEIEVPVTWDTNWTLGGTPISAYNPNPQPGATNENRCYDFTLEAKVHLHFQVDNTSPGGEPRTIGYWKNWTRCDGKGKQDITADNNGGSAAGYWLLDDVLPITLGETAFAACVDAVAILDKRDVSDGTKRAGDGAYALAAQLMAAKANYEAGAETCPAATDAIIAADELLAGADFDGSGTYAKGKGVKALKQSANELAGILDRYNNGTLCP
jgi:hypothetical protein